MISLHSSEELREIEWGGEKFEEADELGSTAAESLQIGRMRTKFPLQ